ncbi:hypothetical protein CORC01_12708 [Colletotrichum orchidophilum]|uniref:Ubiquitin-like domain-containing protein n=1 Tax=Colletotrichum orchidophilum TaxID=1209926 RepID=A0A1G4ASG0_9PEZI|nr:uncharacterized protein CORC01_12708 [Colletotrichum orchidophilum]OHE91972.1 hypothetical protein CORC01_12708 [Colletotrichum orchidophilum]
MPLAPSFLNLPFAFASIPTAGSLHKMAAPVTDLAGIANLGVQLATKLAIYQLGTSGSDSDIHNLSDDVFATAAALSQLREFVAADAHEVSPVYQPAGREAIEDLAIRCGKVYTTIIRSVYRASLAVKVVKDVDFEALGPEDLKASRLRAISDNMDWDMVEEVIETSETQLRWLKASLLLHLQVAGIASLQIKPRCPGSFDEELASRSLAMRLLTCKAKAAKEIVEQIERKERLALADKSDTESIWESEAALTASSSESDDDAASWKSGETANESKPPSVCGDKTYEKANISPVVELATPPPPPPVAPTSFWHQPWDGAPDAGPVEIKLLAPKRRFPAKVFKTMGKWFKGMFGRSTIPSIGDLELEATVLRNGPFPESFLALEPKMLRLELKRILKQSSKAPGDAFLVQDDQLRSAVQGALFRAQRKDGRVRQLITVDIATRPDVAVVFMSVDPAAEPVHMTDILGRKYDIPFEQCRTVQGARVSIHQRFKDVNRLWNLVRDGAYEIVDENDTVITPEAWITTIKPGAILHMRISAFNDGMNGGVYVPPGAPDPLTWAEPYTPPPPPPVWRGPAPPPGMRPPGRFPPGAVPRGCMPLPPPPPFPRVIMVEPRERAELGFEPDFGPNLTREEDLGEGRKDLGRWVALWTNAADTDFTSDSGGIPSYDDASSIMSGSSSSSDEIVDD